MMRIQMITLLLATMSTGLMAGIFFTWTNAVTPGIGKLNDMGYLQALQSMNRVILNPAFYAVFMGAVITVVAALVLNYKTAGTSMILVMVAATVIYILGSFLVTIFGNVPLNELLDKADLATISTSDASALRTTIETKWNQFNLVRTIASTGAFALLVIACLLMNRL